MKRRLLVIIGLILLVSLLFVSCGETVEIVGAYINENGELILEMSDKTEKNLGVLEDRSSADENPQGLNFCPLSDGNYAVSVGNAKYLEEIVIPATYNGKPVTSIGESAFNNCTGLTSVTIPNSVTNIGDYAFWCCSGLTTIRFEGTEAQWDEISKGVGWNFNTGNYTVIFN